MEEKKKLTKFAHWLQQEAGLTNLVFLHGSFDSVPFLLCHKKSENYDLKYLPAFQLLVTYEATGLKYKLRMINYMGKLLDRFSKEFPEDLSSEKIPDFANNLLSDKSALCHGLSSQKFAPKNILVEELNGKIVIRSRKCLYAVAKKVTVCEVCAQLEDSKNKKDLEKREVLKKTAPQKETQFVDINFSSGQDKLISAPFYDSSDINRTQPEEVVIKIDPDLCYLPEATPVCSSVNIFKIEPHENIFEPTPETQEIENGNIPKSKHQTIRLEKPKIVWKKDKDLSSTDLDEEKSHQKSPKKKVTVRKICASCNEGFSRFYLFTQHLKENEQCKLFLKAKQKEDRKSAPPKPENPNKYRRKCPICCHVYRVQKNFDADQELHKKQIKRLDDPVECPTCETIIDKRRDLNIHFEQEHTKNTGAATDQLLCLECLRPSTKRWIKSHFLAVHSGKGKKFLCSLCSFRTRLPRSLHKHTATVHGLSPDLSTKVYGHICDHCGQKFRSFDALKMHISVKHINGLTHSCKECPKKFANLKHLMVHMVCVHLNIRPFKCRSCSYTSGTMSGIFKHFGRLHGGVRGGRADVVVLEDELKQIRKTLKYNYCVNSVGNYF